jgi:hypothetical protein
MGGAAFQGLKSLTTIVRPPGEEREDKRKGKDRGGLGLDAFQGLKSLATIVRPPGGEEEGDGGSTLPRD